MSPYFQKEDQNKVEEQKFPEFIITNREEMNQYNSNLQWCSLLENSVDLDDENGIETESNFLFNKQSNKKLKRVNSQEYLSLHNRKQFDNFSENNGFSKDESL